MAGALDALRALYEEGGFVMPWLFGAAVVLWATIGFRVATLRRGSTLPLKALWDAALQGALPSPRGLLDTAAARCAARTRSPARPGSVRLQKMALGGLLGDVAGELHRGGALIHAIVIAAPLTGLLGTVAGMIEVFSSLGDAALFAQSGGIAGGVAQALTTTQMGLAVAIPGTVAARLLDARARRLEDELNALVELAVEAPCAA